MSCSFFQFWRSSSESTLPTLRTNVDSTRVKTWEGKLLQRFKSQSMLLVTTKEKKVCDINLLWILGLVTSDDYGCINRLEAHISNIYVYTSFTASGKTGWDGGGARATDIEQSRHKKTAQRSITSLLRPEINNFYKSSQKWAKLSDSPL